MITSEQLEQWKELSNSATPGPWYYGTDPDQQYDDERERNPLTGKQMRVIVSAGDGSHIMAVWADGKWTQQTYYDDVDINGEFIAASREAVPALVEEVDRLRAELEAARGEINNLAVENRALKELSFEKSTVIIALEAKLHDARAQIKESEKGVS